MEHEDSAPKIKEAFDDLTLDTSRGLWEDEDDDAVSTPTTPVTRAFDATRPHTPTQSSPLRPSHGAKVKPSPERGSPIRKPATPLRGIGQFLRQRRRGQSPDSPSVRQDLLSGSVVAGLVAAAIQEVETATPNPSSNKPMADLIERAVRAELRAKQLENQKSELWNLVSLAEADAEKAESKQYLLVGVVLLMFGADGVVLTCSSLWQKQEIAQWVSTLLVVHMTMLVPVLYTMWAILRKPNSPSDSIERQSESGLDYPSVNYGRESPETKEDDQVAPTENNVVQQDHDVKETLEDLKDALLLLPRDQKGGAWLGALEDTQLLCFLRGHMLDVKKALKYLVKCAEWRVDYDTENLVSHWNKRASRASNLLLQTFPLYYVNSQKDSARRVYLFRVAMCDFPGYFRSCAAEDITRHVVHELEKHRTASNGVPGILIVDLGYSESEAAIRPASSINQVRLWIVALLQFISNLTKIADPYYPETVEQIYFVRAPFIFWPLWRIVQLLMPIRTKEKAKFVTRLTDELDVECVPDYLGGHADTSGSPKGGLIVPSAAMRALELS